jgi:hypothetical protein
MSTIDRDPVTQREDAAIFAKKIGERIEDFKGCGIVPIESEAEGVKVQKIKDLRRSGRRRGEEPGGGCMTLVNVDGVLHWELGTGPAPSRLRRGRRMRRGPDRVITGTTVRQFKFQDLPPNLVGQKLRDLDGRLTPKQGLRVVSQDTGAVGRVAEAVAAPGDKILLFVHGTFSNCDNLIGGLRQTEEGKRLFRRLVQRNGYKQVLAFNHPTLSTSPILNAAELARNFRKSQATVDVICHSRGGLVTRWWREFLDHSVGREGRVVFAGSPMAGTGLAAPARLKESLDLLTNFSETMGAISRISGAIIPGAYAMGEAAAVLFGWFGKIMAMAARTPIIDAGVQLVPGLAAQSREGANNELLNLRASYTGLTDSARNKLHRNYFYLTSNFETNDPGWKFWRYFRKDKLLDLATDAVFEGDNDLVVDTQSMTSLDDQFDTSSIPTKHIERFGERTDRVHHLNYFQQPETLTLLRTAFNLNDG